MFVFKDGEKLIILLKIAICNLSHLQAFYQSNFVSPLLCHVLYLDGLRGSRLGLGRDGRGIPREV